MERLGIEYDLLPRESEILHLKFWDAAFELLKQRNAGGRLVPGEVFDYRQQLRVFLAHDFDSGTFRLCS